MSYLADMKIPDDGVPNVDLMSLSITCQEKIMIDSACHSRVIAFIYDSSVNMNYVATECYKRAISSILSGKSDSFRYSIDGVETHVRRK